MLLLLIYIDRKKKVMIVTEKNNKNGNGSNYFQSCIYYIKHRYVSHWKCFVKILYNKYFFNFRIGRRTISIVSGIGISISLSALTMYLQFFEDTGCDCTSRLHPFLCGKKIRFSKNL